MEEMTSNFNAQFQHTKFPSIFGYRAESISLKNGHSSAFLSILLLNFSKLVMQVMRLYAHLITDILGIKKIQGFSVTHSVFIKRKALYQNTLFTGKNK